MLPPMSSSARLLLPSATPRQVHATPAARPMQQKADFPSSADRFPCAVMTRKLSARLLERVLIAVLAVVAITCGPRGAVTPAPTPPVVSPPTGEAGGHPVYTDQIGVLFIPGSTPNQGKAAQDRFGLPMIKQHGPRLATFALGARTRRAEPISDRVARHHVLHRRHDDEQPDRLGNGNTPRGDPAKRRGPRRTPALSVRQRLPRQVE